MSWINKSRHDLYYAKSNLYRTDIKSAISSPVHNLMTIISQYLGSRADKLPSYVPCYPEIKSNVWRNYGERG